MNSRFLVITILVVSALLSLATSYVLDSYTDKLMEASLIIHGPPPGHINSLSASISQVIKKPFVLEIENEILSVPPEHVKTWSEFYYRDFTKKYEYRVNYKAIKKYVEEMTPSYNIAPVNGILAIENGKISDFRPSKNGKIMVVDESANAIASAMTNNTNRAKLTINILEPMVNSSKAEQLGLNKLISKSEISFGGSTKNRIHNIKVGAEKLQSILLKPGEEFSMNKALEDNKASTGYMLAPVLKGGQYSLEYGGGLCQVSTTLFRSAMEAGLEITERHSHSRLLSYYQPDGYDAAIYPKRADLRFINNTPANILIQSEISANSIAFKIYGTDDGRKITIGEPSKYKTKSGKYLKTILTRTIDLPQGVTKTDKFNSTYRLSI